MPELAESLAERGFRQVDAGLPGGWATDGDVTVCSRTRQRGGGMGSRSTLQHEVYVYDAEPGLISIETQPAATATDTAYSAALRQALAEAKDGGRDE